MVSICFDELCSRFIPVSVIIAVQNTVKTSFSRPLSKPRVRNPLTSLKQQNQGSGISPPLSGSVGPIPSIGTKIDSLSASRVEQDFLASGNGEHVPNAGWGEDDDSYFMIPEDTTILNSSLSSSLSSLCGHKDAENAPDVS